jgi:hypothetical protein
VLIKYVIFVYKGFQLCNKVTITLTIKPIYYTQYNFLLLWC